MPVRLSSNGFLASVVPYLTYLSSQVSESQFFLLVATKKRGVIRHFFAKDKQVAVPPSFFSLLLHSIDKEYIFIEFFCFLLFLPTSFLCTNLFSLALCTIDISRQNFCQSETKRLFLTWKQSSYIFAKTERNVINHKLFRNYKSRHHAWRGRHRSVDLKQALSGDHEFEFPAIKFKMWESQITTGCINKVVDFETPCISRLCSFKKARFLHQAACFWSLDELLLKGF